MSTSASPTPPNEPNRPRQDRPLWQLIASCGVAILICILFAVLLAMLLEPLPLFWLGALLIMVTVFAGIAFVGLVSLSAGWKALLILLNAPFWVVSKLITGCWKFIELILAVIRLFLDHFVIPVLTPLLAPIWYCVVKVLWRCAYASITVAAVAFLFLVNDQGQDLLRLSSEQVWSVWNLFFWISAAVLGLSLWYSARLLLSLRVWGEDCGWNPAAINRFFWPPIFGLAVPTILVFGFRGLAAQGFAGAHALAVAYALLAVLLSAAFWFLPGQSQRARGRTAPITLEEQSLIRIVLHASLLSCLTLLVVFVAWPVSVPQLLGAPAIVLFGLMGIALFGGLVLTYWLLVWDLPPATAMALLVVAAAFGFYNDNHGIRVSPEEQVLARQTAADQFRDWSAARLEQQAPGRTPVILVAASGGGIRAAYWTASTLATMEAIGGFRDHLFSISGVSGGSVGAAVYTAIDYERRTGGAPDTLERVKTTLGQDFLSPVVAGMLFPDLIQRFLPWPIAAFDRQRFLEMGFEQALGGDHNPLADSFSALYQDQALKYQIPSLLLNTTVVDSGQRAVVSNIALTGFTDTPDLLADGYQTRDILLSAAAGASARFTYVSPAGSLIAPGKEANERQKVRVVDGGYFENSGAATTMDLLSLLPTQAFYPILILIRNDPTVQAVCKGRPGPAEPSAGPAGPPAGNFLSELSSPLFALLNARTARGRLAEVDAAKRVESMNGAVIEVSLAAVMKTLSESANDQEALARVATSLPEPPLGWSLSRAMRESMDKTLADALRDPPDDRGLGAEFQNLRTVLSGQTGSYRRCEAQ